MDVLRFDDPARFAAIATPLLMRDEAENCFFLGLLSNPAELAKTMMCVVRDGTECVAVATMSPGRQMVMTRTSASGAIALARHLHEQRVPLPGIGAVRETAETFARAWVGLTGAATRIHVELAVHQLTRVIPPPRPAAGRMRVADMSDVDLVARWITDFRIEIGEGGLGSGREVAERRIPGGNIFLWEDNAKAVAMTGVSGPTPNGIRVNLVYTLPMLRGRGYASNVVAAVSQRMLDTGKKFCFLYTDLANPTSNKIYRQLGYQPLSQSVHIMFDGAAGSH